MKVTKMLGLAVALAIAGAANSAHAALVLVDFEDVAQPPGVAISLNPTVSRGFQFTASLNGGVENNVDGAFNDTTYFFGIDGAVTVNLGGTPFSLLSFDAAEDFTAGARTLTVTGNKVGGGSVVAILGIDGLFDGSGGIPDFQTFVLGPTFSNLTSVNFAVTGSLSGVQDFGLDNLLFAPAPEPATAALGLLGLAGLMLRRRRIA